MAILKAFKGYRPPKNIVKELASRPYDVLNSSEARDEASGNIYSLLHIIKPEIDLDDNINLYNQEVYNKAKDNFEEFKAAGWLKQDEKDYIQPQIKNADIIFAVLHFPASISFYSTNRAVIQSNINLVCIGGFHPPISIKNRQDIQTEIVVQMSLA